MFLYQRFIPGLAIYSYFVGDERTRSAAVIDPTRDIDEFLAIARREGFRIEHVLETHVHADFVSGSSELAERLDGRVTVHTSALGGEEWLPPYGRPITHDREPVQLGAIRLEAFHTPGHTPEHVSWILFDETRSSDIPWLIFTGDFLFVGDVGRPDLLGNEARIELAHSLYGSIFNRLDDLPEFTEIFPAHGAGSLCGKALGSRGSSTLGFERRFSAALRHAPETEWIRRLLEGMPIAPPYFRRMKQVNAKGPRILGPRLPGDRGISARELKKRACEHCLIVDVRSKEAYAAAHIPGSINIPRGPSLPTWAGWVLPYDHPTLLVLDDPRNLPEVVTHLIRVGFDDVQGWLEDGIDSWETAGHELSTLRTWSVHDLARELRPGGSQPYVLDVRTDAEWESGHIENAHHVHGGLLRERFDEIPRDRRVAVVCGSGYRASIAASFLEREGFEDVVNVLGGMTAWKEAKLPSV